MRTKRKQLIPNKWEAVSIPVVDSDESDKEEYTNKDRKPFPVSRNCGVGTERRLSESPTNTNGIKIDSSNSPIPDSDTIDVDQPDSRYKYKDEQNTDAHSPLPSDIEEKTTENDDCLTTGTDQDHCLSSAFKNDNTSNEYGFLLQSFDSTEDVMKHYGLQFPAPYVQTPIPQHKILLGRSPQLVCSKSLDNGHSGRIKYTDEQKRDMVQYALEHGPAKTAQEFSIRLQMPVSESTVRVALKAYHLSEEGKDSPMPKVYHKPVTYNKYTQEQKDEIAQYAMLHGPSKTARDFSLKWGLRMGESFVRSTVRQFKKKVQREADVIDFK